MSVSSPILPELTSLEVQRRDFRVLPPKSRETGLRLAAERFDAVDMNSVTGAVRAVMLEAGACDVNSSRPELDLVGLDDADRGAPRSPGALGTPAAPPDRSPDRGACADQSGAGDRHAAPGGAATATGSSASCPARCRSSRSAAGSPVSGAWRSGRHRGSPAARRRFFRTGT